MHVQLSLLPGALLILVAVRVSVGKEESRASSPFYIEFLKMRLECNDYEKLKGYQRIMRIAMFGRGWLGYKRYKEPNGLGGAGHSVLRLAALSNAQVVASFTVSLLASLGGQEKKGVGAGWCWGGFKHIL